MTLKALIFDVDGTLAETEEYHRISFNQAFKEHDLNWNWDTELYSELLKVTGGKERILHYAKRIDWGVINAIELHARKTEIYSNKVIEGQVELKAGVEALINHSKQAGLRLAIATTTSRENVDNLLKATLGPSSLDMFDAICCGDEVTRKKPDPAIYQLALERLSLNPPSCLAFEDSRNGLLSAMAAKLPVVVTPSLYTSKDNFNGATLILKDLTEHFSCKGFTHPAP